jgi:ABC-type multidrug transport system permease subunit
MGETGVAPVARAMVAIVRRDAILYLSYRNRLGAQLVTIFFGLVLFYYVSRLVHVSRFPDPDQYFAYVVMGLVILPVLTATLSTLPQTLRGELLAGTFERLVVSPLGPVASVVAMTVFPAAAALFIGLVTVGLGVIVFGLDIHWVTAPLALPVSVLGALALMPFALLVAAVVLLAKQAGSLGPLIVIGLSLAGGVYFPIALMPGWIQWVSYVQPFTPALELMRHLLIGAPMEHTAIGSLARLVGFAVVATPLAHRVLAASVRLCRRRGTLIEY